MRRVQKKNYYFDGKFHEGGGDTPPPTKIIYFALKLKPSPAGALSELGKIRQVI